jgi:hypothetical protein
MAVLLRASLAAMAVVGALACSTDLDCNLNGACVSSMCDCNPGWILETCSALNVAPVDPNVRVSLWAGGMAHTHARTLAHIPSCLRLDGRWV